MTSTKDLMLESMAIGKIVLDLTVMVLLLISLFWVMWKLVLVSMLCLSWLTLYLVLLLV